MSIELRTSKLRKALALLFFTGLFAFSYYFLFIDPIQVSKFRGFLAVLNFFGDATQITHILFWILLVCSCLLFLMNVRRIFSNRPDAIISDAGIHLVSYGLDRISWNNIAEVRVCKMWRNEFLGIIFKEEDRVKSKVYFGLRIMGALNKMIDYPFFAIPLFLSAHKKKELLDILKRQRKQSCKG